MPLPRRPGLIDLRSDTVTLPSAEMRAAIAQAALGDDVFGEDPTANALEARAADLLGKEAALFVPSGTMGNLLAVMTHARPGDELICGSTMHTYASEAGGAARLAGVSTAIVPQRRAEMAPADIVAAIRPDDPHCPRTTLLWIEQPQLGWIVPMDSLATVSETARARGLSVHMDGARIFNAAVALGASVETLARHADSVMFCVSKGLGAPAGSLLVGSRAFIAAARRNRKVVGGGLRQAGILAAAGLFALDRMVDRLAEDHAHAAALAAGLRSQGWRVDRDVPETNIFFAEPPSGVDVEVMAGRMRAAGVEILTRPSSRVIRLVTHYGIEAADIERVLDVCYGFSQ